MEKEIKSQQQHPLSTAITVTPTTTILTKTTPTASDKDNGRGHSHIVSLDSGDSSITSTMGGNRSGSSSSSVGWMGEGGEGSSSSSSSTTTTTTTTATTTGVKTPTTPRQPSNRDSGYHTDFSFSPASFSSHVHFTFDTTTFPDTHCGSLAGSLQQDSSYLSQGSHHQGSSSLVEPGSPTMGSTTPSSLPPRTFLAIGPCWQPRRVLPDVDSDDEGDDDAFVSDDVMIGATSHLPGLHTIPSREAQQGSHASTSSDRRQSSDGSDDRRGGADDERRRSRNWSPRTVAFRGIRSLEVDDDTCEEGVSCTDYHHAPLSLLTLPGGERIRPLMARTIATQTPHLHCQLIDQILDCPQEIVQIARGSAVRRLRYYSEGEESVGVSTLIRGPLPDLVPVTQGHRERSLSAPDLESLQRQRMAAREVGRELRRISDEFVRNHEALRDHHQYHHGTVAALHAELNGVAAFFLTGVRRFLYRGFAGYFRHVFHWTRQAMAASRNQETRPRRGSFVDHHR
ncbi:uncharacterized protein LOC143280813 [Babylonia areolata]|uniref:uncharacterized protein LOC143280813 n=1 Tax=Babylonia areolata TaxID=304850 RepID=UPI003FD6ACC0